MQKNLQADFRAIRFHFISSLECKRLIGRRFIKSKSTETMKFAIHKGLNYIIKCCEHEGL